MDQFKKDLVSYSAERDSIKEVNTRIKEIIDGYIESHPRIIAEFAIDRDPIYKYISFYFWVKQLQERESRISVRQFFNQLIEDDEFRLHLENEVKIKEREGKQTSIVEEEERFYGRTVDQYPHLNYRTNIEKEVRKLYGYLVEENSKGDLTSIELELFKRLNDNEKEFKEVSDIKACLYLIDMITKIKNQKNSGNMVKDRAIQLKESQKFAYKSNRKINELRQFSTHKKTYKKIHNASSTLSKINYKNLQELYEYYKEEIDNSTHLEKGLDYYQLEKCLNFSLITEILYQMNKYPTLTSEEIDLISKDMVYVTLLPFIDQRQKYVSLYFEWGEKYRENWRWEVKGLYKCTLEMIQIVLGDLYLKSLVEELTEDKFDYSIVGDYYLPESYTVSYPKHQIGVKNLPQLLKSFEEYNRLFDEAIARQLESLNDICFLK